MAIINRATKEPARRDKTTNLLQVHDPVQTATGNKGKPVSLATSSDRTLFFDFLPIEAIRGSKTEFQFYTVPGQVIYNYHSPIGPARGKRHRLRRRVTIRKNAPKTSPTLTRT